LRIEGATGGELNLVLLRRERLHNRRRFTIGPTAAGCKRSVVLVEGIASLNERLAGRERDVIIRALTKSGAAAAVISEQLTSA